MAESKVCGWCDACITCVKSLSLQGYQWRNPMQPQHRRLPYQRNHEQITRTPLDVLGLSVASMYADMATGQALPHPKPKKVLTPHAPMRVNERPFGG
jgi:hypothetical protein